jgi:serine phosphatase RsbU (regulator of sigma subunit)/pSer/pThr/pTyr-binding forkhead associated (FHA) protein
MADARLQVTDTQGRRVVLIDKDLFTIGRRTAADLQVVSTDVSREHAEIAVDAGRFLLRDRGSRYGTFVNGEQISERVLAHGDRIRLGRTEAIELIFTIGDGDGSGLRQNNTASDLTDLGQMAAILNGLRALGSGRVLDEVLTLVMDSALDVTRADRGFIMLANTAGELEFKTARGRGRVPMTGTSFTTSTKIPREVFQTGESRIVGDLMDGDLAAVHEGTIAIGIRHVLCVPLRVHAPDGRQESATDAGQVIGVLYLDGRDRNALLSRATLGSLEAFATQAALAIESARLYAESAEKARIERDLRVAADIQQALLPAPAYDAGICDLAAVTVPCRTVGGDFYDYIDLGEGGFGFALGDVAGKGPPAALLAATAQSNFVAHASVSPSAADTMSRINKALLRRAIEARFATMFYGIVRKDGTLEYCNAGQEPPLVLRADGEVWLETGGPVIGLLPIASYDSGRLPLAAGDLVIVCSDGVTEARNVANEEFGQQRLLDAVRGARGDKPEAVLDRLVAAVKAFSRGAAQADDITAMVLRYRG